MLMQIKDPLFKIAGIMKYQITEGIVRGSQRLNKRWRLIIILRETH